MTPEQRRDLVPVIHSALRGGSDSAACLRVLIALDSAGMLKRPDPEPDFSAADKLTDDELHAVADGMYADEVRMPSPDGELIAAVNRVVTERSARVWDEAAEIVSAWIWLHPSGVYGDPDGSLPPNPYRTDKETTP